MELARDAVVGLRLPLGDIEPHEALLGEVRRTAEHVAALGLIVADLEEDRIVHGVTKTVQLPDGSRRVEVAAALNVWMRLYQAERRHLLDACRTAIRCGVEERRVRLEEEKGQLIADMFRRVFEDPALGLSHDQQRTAKVAAARHLRLIGEAA